MDAATNFPGFLFFSCPPPGRTTERRVNPQQTEKPRFYREIVGIETTLRGEEWLEDHGLMHQ
jgi:hypothetical protein